MKSSGLFTELCQCTKRSAGKIPAYGGKNKSGLMDEKKPAYGRIIAALISVNWRKLFMGQKRN